VPGSLGFEPFRTIWFSPRATMRRIVETDPRRRTWTLVSLVTFYMVLDTLAATVPLEPPMPVAAFLSLGPTGSVLLAAALSLLGIPSLPPMGMLYRWVCGWFGGVASRPEVIAVLTWGAVPLLAAWTVTWLVQGAVFGSALFTGAASSAGGDHAAIILLLVLLQLIGSIWSVVATVIGLSEVNRMSVPKAIAAAAAGTAIVLVPLLMIVVIAVTALFIILMSR
jgi:hypothetical protein